MSVLIIDGVHGFSGIFARALVEEHRCLMPRRRHGHGELLPLRGVGGTSGGAMALSRRIGNAMVEETAIEALPSIDEECERWDGLS